VPVSRRPLLEYLAKTPAFVRFFVPKGFLNCVKRWEWGKGLAVVPRHSSISSAVSEPPHHAYNYLYTSSGLASHAALRLFCPPEVIVFTLVRDESGDKPN